jgi:hypothetical protein
MQNWSKKLVGCERKTLQLVEAAIHPLFVQSTLAWPESGPKGI